MRILFFAVVVALEIGSCVHQKKTTHAPLNNALFDLSESVYLVPDSSFFSGCDEDPAGEKICHDLRIGQIGYGIKKWTRYFDQDSKLELVILGSEADLPAQRKNRFVYLKLAPGLWECAGHPACYYNTGMDHKSGPVISFDGFANITCGYAEHEIGHVFGRDDNDVPAGVRSVMSYAFPADVTPLDFQILLAMHPELLD